MLNAILRGKRWGICQSLLDGENEGNFEGIEDTLTATVFERLLYLPDTEIAEILFSLWSDPCVPIGGIVSSEFWPRWDAIKQDGQRQREPDCSLEWPKRVLVIESKRYDYRNMQEPMQLAKEALAAHVRYPDKKIWLLAVGGLRDDQPLTIGTLRTQVVQFIEDLGYGPGDWLNFSAALWRSLFLRIHQQLHGGSPERDRLLRDIRAGLWLHGIATEPPGWLNDLVRLRDRLGHITDASIGHFDWHRDGLGDIGAFGHIHTAPAFFWP